MTGVHRASQPDVRHEYAARSNRRECAPIVEPDGTRRYHFCVEGEYAALLGLVGATDGGVPDGPRTSLATALAFPVDGLALAA